MTENSEAADIRLPTDTIDATDPIDAKEPIDPMDSTEPTEPMDRIEPRDPIDSTDCSDRNDSFDVSDVAVTRSSVIRAGYDARRCSWSRTVPDSGWGEGEHHGWTVRDHELSGGC